ncbi:helix-turn-helix transcriptional regulator [Psychromonas sp.]|uniref:helix-turn-helix transcriptional regulator n=1 Tax=Psychromonas sp. TaxID=1884585 RepID=UPI003565B1AA
MRLIKLQEVIHTTGLGRSSIYKFMEEGEFPKSISLGARTIAWQQSDIQEWIQKKISARNQR